MFKVKSPGDAKRIISEAFLKVTVAAVKIRTNEALGRVLAEDISACEDIPSFTRSTVDGYAVLASDTYGASEGLPAMLKLTGEVLMGESPGFKLVPGECASLPTGGKLPEGADAAVMVEFTDDFGDMVLVKKPSAPGANTISRGEDAKSGQLMAGKGTVIRPQHIGMLNALGITEISVTRQLKVGVISTGDELIPPDRTPTGAEIRDVNTGLLESGIIQAKQQPVIYGIIKDDYALLYETLEKAAKECDVVLISGGSSVGLKDSTARVISELGELLLHGIAVKPGKPTIAGKIGDTAVFGLPGHPVAAYFIYSMFVVPLMDRLLHANERLRPVIPAKLMHNIPSNHGREEYVAVALKKDGDGWAALPAPGKSGLISTLTHADGYVCVPRDSEGLEKDKEVYVHVF